MGAPLVVVGLTMLVLSGFQSWHAAVLLLCGLALDALDRWLAR
jgi:phosphatidylglycerophosphate synthase